MPNPRSTEKPGFDGSDFIGFGDIGGMFETHDDGMAPSTSRGQKRTVAEVLAKANYLNKKQETDARTRNCPWAARVKWDKLTNPAQM